jgi:hypothetical protein
VTILLNPACGGCDCTGGVDILAVGTFTYANGNYRAGSVRISQSAGVRSFTADVGNVDPGILAMAYDSDNDQLYLAGEFTEINGTARRGIARVNATTGDLDTSWDPNPNGDVLDVALSSGIVYFVGTFTTVGGTGRNRAAAVDTSGVLQSWNPDCNAIAEAVAVGGGWIYVGGVFTTCGGVTRHCIARFSAAGALSAWNPDVVNNGLGSPPGVIPGEVYTIMVASVGGKVYIGGYFDRIGGGAGTLRRYAACLDPNTGAATSWDASVDSIVWEFSFDPWSGGVAIVGDFNTVHGLTRNYAAFLDDTGFAVAPDFNFGAAGFGRSCLIDGDGSEATGNFYFGGGFRDSSNVNHIYIAKFDSDGNRAAWLPELDAEVYAILEAT